MGDDIFTSTTREEQPAPMPTAELCDFLLWARKNGFRLGEVEMGPIRVTVDDLRGEPGQPPIKGPRSAHEAYAAKLGIDVPADDPDDEDGES